MIYVDPIRGIGMIRGRLPLTRVVRRVRETTAEEPGSRMSGPLPPVRVEDLKVRRVKGRTAGATRTPGLRAQSPINKEQPGGRRPQRVDDHVAPQIAGDAADQMMVEAVTAITVMTLSPMMVIRIVPLR